MPEPDIIQKQRAFFQNGSTWPVSWRVAQLRTLLAALDAHEEALLSALHKDLGKPPMEAWVSEIGYLRMEIQHTLRKLPSWAKSRRAGVPAYLWPARARIQAEPLGTALIIGPWNYPLQLALAPAIAAIAAGNTAILKPSELAPHTSQSIADLIANSFPPEFLSVSQGGHETTLELIRQRPDLVFFTGGTRGGAAILEAAAPLCIPTVLELGGKSPAIVGPDAPLTTTARRIVWGKFLNAGQTCIAPDHLWVHSSVAKAFIEEMRHAIQDFYGNHPENSPDYGRICHPSHCQSLVNMLKDAEILHGGKYNQDIRYVEPTLLGKPIPGSRLATEEIFGPLLPVLEYVDPEEIIHASQGTPTPLALYVFTKQSALRNQLISGIRSAGVCINDTISQILPPELPFGGLGRSGFGRYHGKAGFDTFSHPRPILHRSFFGENSFRYPPPKLPLSRLKRLFRRFIE